MYLICTLYTLDTGTAGHWDNCIKARIKYAENDIQLKWKKLNLFVHRRYSLDYCITYYIYIATLLYLSKEKDYIHI